MAISLVGIASNSRGTDGSLVVTLPGGMQEGDVVYTADGAGGGVVGIVTSGYTTLNDQTFAIAYRKIMGATPDTTVEFSSLGAALNHIAIAVVLRTVDQGTPEDATTTGGSTAPPDSPSITTVTDNAWVLVFSVGLLDATITAPSGYTDQHSRDESAALDADITMAFARKEVTSAGAEDPAAWTDWTSVGFARNFTIAVRPAAASTQNLTPSLYASAATFFTPTVTPGAVSLTPSLYTSTATFFAPTVTAGAVTLTPALYASAATFHSPTVMGGTPVFTITRRPHFSRSSGTYWKGTA